jgi:hypothetical protein
LDEAGDLSLEHLSATKTLFQQPASLEEATKAVGIGLRVGAASALDSLDGRAEMSFEEMAVR